MYKVSDAEVKRIASLSNIKLEGDDLKNLTQDFNQILEFVKKIDEADVENIEPKKHILSDETAKKKQGQKTENVALEDIRKMAPKFEGGYFVVPQVIETS